MASVEEEIKVDTNPGTDSKASQEAPSRIPDDDAREFVKQLRSAPAERIIADVFSTLLTAAEVKLGRRDARLFIDLCAALLQHAERYVSEDLDKQVESVLGQLRLAQVGAESRRGEKAESEPNDLSRTPTPSPAGARAGR